MLLRHVPSRWLTLNPAAKRFDELYTPLKRYFSECAPKKANLKKNKRYIGITALFERPDIEIQLLVILESSQIFYKYLSMLQQRKPLIHKLHAIIQSIIRDISKKASIKSTSNLSQVIVQKN